MPRLMLVVLMLISVAILTPVIPASAAPHGQAWAAQLPGLWVGTWGNESQIGTMTITIGQTGAFTGSLHNESVSVDGSMTGQIDNSGAIPCNLTFTYVYGSDVYTAKGTALMNGRDHLVAIEDLYLSNGKHLGTIAIDLAKASAR